ncbi:phage tail tape measure protein, partial [uncultured Halomonas sp.]|uniref:phage tail tape measure protein n=1 Tax=uncultured Halomonas sp. TaxID=173971 RepID=UPI0026236CC7
GMRMEVSELSRVNDVLAATAARSNTTIQQLGQALSFAAPFAASAGISIEEAAAAIGNMSDAGIQASRAGTGLVGVIRQLSNVTSGGEAVLDKYGLSIEDVSIEAHGLGRVLETLREANLSTADALALFGSEAGAAAQVLVSDYRGAVEGATGEAERMANQMDQGLLPAFKGLGSAVAEATLQMGDSGIAGSLETLVRTATGVVSSINGMSNEFNAANGITERHNAVIQTLTGSLQVLAALAAGRLAVSLGTATMALGAKTAAAVAANGAVVTLTRSLALLGGPAGILIAAGTAAYLFRDSINSTSRAANRAKQEIDNLTASINLNSEASIRSGIADLERKLVEVQAEAAQASAELDQARLEMTDQAADAARGAGQAYNQAKAKADEYRGAISGLKGELEQLTAQEDRLAEVRALGVTATDGLDDSTKELTTSIGSLAAGASDATREIDEMRRAFESLMDRLFPLEAQQRRYREEQLLLTQAWNEGAISADRYTEAMRRLEQAQLSQQTPGQAYGGIGFGSQIGDPVSGMGAMGEAGYWDQWLESARTALTDFDQMAANTAESFQRGFGNAFESMIMDSNSLRDAAHQLFDGMARTMINALGQMAAQWVAYQAVQMATGRSAEAAAIAGATTTGTAIASAYAPAAAAASLASFGGNSAPAMAGIAATHSLSQTMALSGMAHDGIDRVPKEGTWLLDKGERVVRRDQADRLDAFLDRQGAGDSAPKEDRIRIINTLDAGEVVSAGLGSPAGERTLVNWVVRNRDQINRSLGRTGGRA